MAATPSQDLDYHEFKDGDTLPFRNDPTNGFDFKVVKPVIPTERYAADFQGSFILKRISLELSEPGQGIKPQDKQLFLREAKALRHARHRHVIDIAMAFSFEGLTEMYFAIVMDRADGDIQRYLMCQAKLEERQKYIPRWFGCLAEAVTHIHDIGIRHRDIKPANILVKGGSILLADFGISKMGLGKTLSTTVPGWQRGNTPKYAAPEVGDGSTRGRAADIFSLGAVFLEMLVALYEPGNLEPKLADVLVTHASSGFEQIGQSYGKQLGSVQKWMNGLHKQLEVDWHGDILRLCREMMKEEREDRLSAETVRSELSKLSRFDNSPRLCSCQDDTALTEDQKLLDACKRKDGLTDVCSLLHENGKLKNTKGAIHQASARGFDDIVKAFLTHNADLDLRDHSDQTPLHCSAANGHEGVVDLLLEKCAGVTSMDEEKQTPLHCASGSGHLSIVTKLLKADTSGSDTLAQNIYGQTALHLAAKRGYEDVVKALITKMGPKEVAVSDNAGQTALHLAAGFGSQNVVETLLEYAVHTSLINKKNTSGWTALHFAAKGKQSKGGYLEVIRCLLGKGADVTERDYDRKTALDHAEENNHKERVGLLKNAVEKGRDAPGATLAPSALTADIGSMTKQLSQIIQPVRKYSDEDIRLASVKLQGFHPGWERLTRVFMVLYASGLPERSLPEVMDRLTQGNITDYRLPVRASDLSDILQPGILARFEEHQQLVLVDELHLEKLKEHCNLRTDEWEGRIEKMKVVGQGNSGQVYQVRNKDTCDVYALKLIRREGPDRERRAGEELNMLKRIKHDNIVSLVGSFTSPAFIGLLIEPIAECDLAEYLLAAGADPDKRSFLFGFFGCLVDALWYLHNVEYVRHNDIKPGNILVRDGRVFLTDFGISLDWSRTLRSTTWDPSPAMTPMYSAPEVKQDDQSRDSFADIWSLGCVFMELMTVLKGRQVDDIRTHLKQRDPRSMAYSENMLPVRRWIEILREAVGYINNDPLEWISNMLREHPKSRPTAGQLRETLNSTSTLRALFFGPCCRANISTRDEAEIAHLVEEEVEEKVPIEQHTCIAAVAWPGECRLYLQGTDGSIRQATRKQDNVLWRGGKMRDEIGRAKLCSPIAATAWEQKSGYGRPTVRVYFLNDDNCVQERTWDPSSEWRDGALGGCHIRAAPTSQLAVTSWNEGNIMLCYQADDRTIRIVNGWAKDGRWQRGSTLQLAAANSPLTVFNFEHYGNRGIRLYFKDETSVFREACWDQIGDEAREDSSYFLGGYSIPASGKASISAIAWLDDELEMRVYVGTGKRIFERRYSGGWMWFEKSLEEGAEEGHISALRWGSGFASVYSVGRDGLVEIVRADGSWTRTRILSKSACRGIDCPLRREPLESSALMPMPPPQQLLPELPNTPPEQVQDLAPEPEDLDSIEQGPQQHEPGGPFLTFAGVCKHYVARPVMAAAAVAIVTVVAAKALWLWQLQRRQRL